MKAPNKAGSGLPLGETQGRAPSWGGSGYSDLTLGMGGGVLGGIQEMTKLGNLPWSGVGEKRDCRKMPRFLLWKRNKLHSGAEKMRKHQISEEKKKKEAKLRRHLATGAPGKQGAGGRNWRDSGKTSAQSFYSAPPLLISTTPPQGTSCLPAPSWSRCILLRNTALALGHPLDVYTGLERKRKAHP